MENAFFLAGALAIALAERFPGLRFERLPVLRPFVVTDAVCLVTGALGLGLLLRAAATTQAGMLAPLVGGVPAALPTAAACLAATVLYDLGGWVSHRLLHAFDVLWRFHEVHHSSRSLDWLATFRAHAVEHALRHVLSPVVLLLLGFPRLAVGVAGVTYVIAAMLGHANLGVRLRFLEPLLVTPRLHRLHHVPETSHANFGTIFSVWDRLRGTLVTDPEARLAPVGVPGDVGGYPERWRQQLVEPFARIRRDRAAGRRRSSRSERKRRYAAVP